MRTTKHGIRPCLLVLAGLLVLGTGAAAARAAGPRYQVAWRVSTTGVWPPAISDGKLMLKVGDEIHAHALSNGKRAWTRKLEDLRFGTGVLAAGARYVYVLGNAQLYLLDPTDGKVARRRAMRAPASVLYRDGSVYVSAADGIHRLDHRAAKQLALAKGFEGELRGADGNHVVVFTRQRGVPRLVVVDLKRNKKAYGFKLLRAGWHRVLRVGGGRVVFIDYSQRTARGKNPRKLYYTEADFVRSKRIKDEELSKKYPRTYPERRCDSFWVADAGKGSGVVFLANHGEPGSHSSISAYDPVHGRLLWSRSGALTSAGLLLHRGLLWTTVTRTGSKQSSHVVAYSPDDGSELLELDLDGAATGTPVAAGARVLVRTRRSVYCLAPASGTSSPAATASAATARPATTARPAAPSSASGGARPGWRLYRDKVAGYLLQTPESWQFDRARLVKMGGLRMSIPFSRMMTVLGRKVHAATLHVLTWEAAGRDVDGLWQSVYSQQTRAHGSVRVAKVVRVKDVGGSGAPGIKAIYSYREPSGNTIQLRSLCVVHHGVAIELRGWASHLDPARSWKEIEGIFATFRPKTFR